MADVVEFGLQNIQLKTEGFENFVKITFNSNI